MFPRVLCGTNLRVVIFSTWSLDLSSWVYQQSSDLHGWWSSKEILRQPDGRHWHERVHHGDCRARLITANRRQCRRPRQGYQVRGPHLVCFCVVRILWSRARKHRQIIATKFDITVLFLCTPALDSFLFCCCRWQFLTEGNDIGFGVFYREMEGRQRAGAMQEVYASERVNSHIVPEQDSLVCERSGTCELRPGWCILYSLSNGPILLQL